MTHPRRLRLAVPLLSLLLAGAATLAAAQSQNWFKAGDTLSDDSGEVTYVQQTVPADLIGDGLTYVRVTNGSCSDSPSSFIVYETALDPPGTGDNAWYGTLEPVSGSMAKPLNNPGDPNVYLEQDGINSKVTVVMSGLPPNITFSICFTKPM
jgi:hypothetical protein